MKLLEWLKAKRDWNTPHCQKCGSIDLEVTLAEWRIGVGIQNNGRSTFRRTCKKCGNTWIVG